MLKKIAIGLLLLFVTIAITASIVVVNAFDKEKINILLYGIDGRENSDSERSDAIILLNINFKSKNIVATSIPRDSYVKVTCKDNIYDKINHAYSYGKEKCLNDTVKQLFEIEKLNNVVLNFEDVIELVDYFGLIELTPEHTFCQSDINMKNKYCFEKGKTILIDGKQALAYMRNRKSLANGDLDRSSNQRQIFKIIVERFLKLSFIDKVKYFNYVKKHVKTDINITDFNVKELINVNNITLNEYTLKGEDYINKYYYYKLDYAYLEKIKKYYI